MSVCVCLRRRKTTQKMTAMSSRKARTPPTAAPTIAPVLECCANALGPVLAIAVGSEDPDANLVEEVNTGNMVEVFCVALVMSGRPVWKLGLSKLR